MRRPFEPREELIFVGTASARLGGAICDRVGRRPGAGTVLRCSEGGIFVRIDENARGRDVFVVQSTLFPANDQLIELTFWMDALKRASAASVTAVIPYFNYAKGDRLDQPRTSIRARVCADMIQNAGADAVIMLDLHSPQVQGFFTRPADELHAVGVMCDAVRQWAPADLTVVSLDSGFVRRLWRHPDDSPAARPPAASHDGLRYGAGCERCRRLWSHDSPSAPASPQAAVNMHPELVAEEC